MYSGIATVETNKYRGNDKEWNVVDFVDKWRDLISVKNFCHPLFLNSLYKYNL